MSSSSEPNEESLKATLHSEQASLDKLSPKSSPVAETLLSKSSRRSRSSLAAGSTSSLSLVLSELTTLNLSAGQTHHVASLSTRAPSSMQSTKPTTKYDTVAREGQEQWTVELHRAVGKDVAGYALCDPGFAPPIRELIAALEANPKQFPKKKGPLKDARAADLKFKNVTFRAVFTLDEKTRIVFVLSLDPHDSAYDLAKTRIRARRRKT
jgi:mRNA-degrading endonuclease RelE of RelBE toxin-antitoxin system